MLNRILLILKTQNLSSSQFADEIGVQRSGISHILSGRNNPSLEFVTKILKRYPEINSDWILFGKGSMYKGMNDKMETTDKEIKKQNAQADLFSFDVDDEVEIEPIKVNTITEEIKYENLNEEKIPDNTINIPEKQAITDEIQPEKIEAKQDVKITEEVKTEKNIQNKKTVEKILVFFTDNTFKEYFPEISK
ncbi:MAG: helix-turn-helix transcriptional regulator [Bacteroidetes bacterium]|nr:helix-turn-helix transcriptional regulator [Bacteroidota bacterium]